MTEAGASTNLIPKSTRGVLPPLLSATWTLPVGAGALAGLLLVGLGPCLGLVSWAQRAEADGPAELTVARADAEVALVWEVIPI